MLSVKNLQVCYGESVILNDVSLEVPSGKVVCLMGRNGVGKTTLLKAIMGLLRNRRGQVIFDSEDLTHRPTNYRARAGIGYVPQGRGIFPHLTVYENLLMGFEALPVVKSDSGALEEMYQLFPVLREMRGRAAGTLSGGQQQQLAIARALVRRPKLLLLDEPTEGIQPSIMLEIEDVILALQARGDMAILLVEQFLDFAIGVADHYYVMETGAIVAEGPIQEFNQEVVKEYLAF
jgi:urea transport system ATP-binding protein